MKAKEAMVLWNWNSDEIEVVKWPDENSKYDSKYVCSAGACSTGWASDDPTEQALNIYRLFNHIVVRDGIDLRATHKAFLEIDEYRESLAEGVPGKNSDDDLDRVPRTVMPGVVGQTTNSVVVALEREGRRYREKITTEVYDEAARPFIDAIVDKVRRV